MIRAFQAARRNQSLPLCSGWLWSCGHQPVSLRINRCAEAFERSRAQEREIARTRKDNLVNCLEAIRTDDRVSYIARDDLTVRQLEGDVLFPDRNPCPYQLIRRSPGEFRAGVNKELVEGHLLSGLAWIQNHAIYAKDAHREIC